jgi:hypothetical protein
MAPGILTIQFRLGYSRNSKQGPGEFTTDGGTISAFDQTYSYTTNAHRAGVYVRILPRTTLSFDEFPSYFKQDNTVIAIPSPTSSDQHGSSAASSEGQPRLPRIPGGLANDSRLRSGSHDSEGASSMGDRRQPSSTDSVHRQPFRFGYLTQHLTDTQRQTCLHLKVATHSFGG